MEPQLLDAEKLPAWLREAAFELENAHGILDEYGVPRVNDLSGNEMTLAARIYWSLNEGSCE